MMRGKPAMMRGKPATVRGEPAMVIVNGSPRVGFPP
jgi:hypothetical protein